MRAGIHWLMAALAVTAAAQAGGLEQSIEAASGRRVRGATGVEGELQPGSRTVLGQPTTLTDPQRVFRGEVLDLEGGLVLERLRFEDPTVALEYADRLLGATEVEPRGQVVAEARGPFVVVLRSERQTPPLEREAERILPAVWGRGKAADAPRSYLGVRDERGLAIRTAPRGPLHEHLERTFELARSRPEPPPGFAWANAERTAFRFQGPDGVRVAVDASTTPSLMVRGSAETAGDMVRALKRLEQALPAPGEDLAITRRIRAASAPVASAPLGSSVGEAPLASAPEDGSLVEGAQGGGSAAKGTPPQPRRGGLSGALNQVR